MVNRGGMKRGGCSYVLGVCHLVDWVDSIVEDNKSPRNMDATLLLHSKRAMS